MVYHGMGFAVYQFLRWSAPKDEARLHRSMLHPIQALQICSGAPPKYGDAWYESVCDLQILLMFTPTKVPVFYMDVFKNSGTPKSSILIRFSIINHPFWGSPIFGNTHILEKSTLTPHTQDAGSWQRKV